MTRRQRQRAEREAEAAYLEVLRGVAAMRNRDLPAQINRWLARDWPPDRAGRLHRLPSGRLSLLPDPIRRNALLDYIGLLPAAAPGRPRAEVQAEDAPTDGDR